MRPTTVFAVVTANDVVALDGEGDPIVFTRLHRAVATVQHGIGERVVPCTLTPTTDGRLHQRVADAIATQPYAQ